MVVVVVVVVGGGGGGGGGGGYSYDTVCGAENGHFSCPTGDRAPEKRPQPVLPRVNATLMLGSSLWGRK